MLAVRHFKSRIEYFFYQLEVVYPWTVRNLLVSWCRAGFLNEGVQCSSALTIANSICEKAYQVCHSNYFPPQNNSKVVAASVSSDVCSTMALEHSIIVWIRNGRLFNWTIIVGNVVRRHILIVISPVAVMHIWPAFGTRLLLSPNFNQSTSLCIWCRTFQRDFSTGMRERKLISTSSAVNYNKAFSQS